MAICVILLIVRFAGWAVEMSSMLFRLSRMLMWNGWAIDLRRRAWKNCLRVLRRERSLKYMNDYVKNQVTIIYVYGGSF